MKYVLFDALFGYTGWTNNVAANRRVPSRGLQGAVDARKVWET